MSKVATLPITLCDQPLVAESSDSTSVRTSPSEPSSKLIRDSSLVSKGSLCALSRSPGPEEEPDTTFRFVDPILQQACCGNVLLIVAKLMDFTHAGQQGPVVFTQFCEHIEGIDIVRVVIAETLEAGNVPDRSNRGAADLTYGLGDIVGHRKDLAGLVIEQE